MPCSDAWTFLAEFLRRPREVGAVLPSSTHLAKEMVASIPWDQTDVVVEIGPGTGAFTGEILSQARDDTRYMAIEINGRLAAKLRRQFPSVAVHVESVSNIARLCRDQGIQDVDVIVSGLPWAIFSVEQQRSYVEAVCSVLKPGGDFVTFAYLQGILLPAGRQFRRLLEEQFGDVVLSNVVWLNIPPAVVYRCRR